MEENNVTVTEMNENGSVEVFEVPTDEFGSTTYVPAVDETRKGGVVTGVLTVLGAGAAVYGTCRLLGKAVRWGMNKAGYQIIKVESEKDEIAVDSDEQDADEVVDAEVREFVEKERNK